MNIKFRVFDKLKNEYLSEDEYFIDGDGFLYALDENGLDYADDEDCIIEMWSGRYANNGMFAIYGNDLISGVYFDPSKSKNCLIEFKLAKVYFDECYLQWMFEIIKPEHLGNMLPLHRIHEVKKVGNIHQKKELLATE